MLLYTAGRAMLWVVVLSACYSMFQYFRAFYHTNNSRRAYEPESQCDQLPPTPARTPTPMG